MRRHTVYVNDDEDIQCFDENEKWRCCDDRRYLA